jgi:hypothetical protein
MNRDNRVRYHKDPTWAEQMRLASVLYIIRQADEAKDYALRNRSVLVALGVAASLGYPAGVRLDPAEPAWPVAFIELPTGQVSWHLPEHIKPWDSHTVEEKNHRVDQFINVVANRKSAAYQREDWTHSVPGGDRPGAPQRVGEPPVG